MLGYIITWSIGLFILHIPYLITLIFGKEVEDELYSDWTEEAPVFLKSDVLKLSIPGTGTFPVDDSLRELSRSARHGRDTGGMELQTRTDRGGTV